MITGETYIYDRLDNEHKLSVELEVEEHTDYVPYGSTHVPMKTAEIIDETWYLDDVKKAWWAIEFRLRMWGLTKDEIKTLQQKVIDRAN